MERGNLLPSPAFLIKAGNRSNFNDTNVLCLAEARRFQVVDTYCRGWRGFLSWHGLPCRVKDWFQVRKRRYLQSLDPLRNLLDSLAALITRQLRWRCRWSLSCFRWSPLSSRYTIGIRLTRTRWWLGWRSRCHCKPIQAEYQQVDIEKHRKTCMHPGNVCGASIQTAQEFTWLLPAQVSSFPR